jgi:hypothetical protein
MRFAKFLRAKLGKADGFDDEVLADAMERFEKTVCQVPRPPYVLRSPTPSRSNASSH